MADETTSSKEPKKDEFKKPILIGRVGKLPKKAKSDSIQELPEEKPPETKEVSTSKIESSETDPLSQDKSTPQVNELRVAIPYKEPKWSGLCPDGSDYSLEVLKSGMILDTVDLTKQPYYVFGRLPNCDVVLAHPTISRHHCVLQYKAFAEQDEPSSGWYLFDLGSTHGTYLNKDKIKVSHYTRVRVGHQIKFGTSTRTFILTGPDFDCEGETELTVTEIKQRAQQMKLERDRMIREATEQREREKLEEERKREERGIDWGMGEDADDETDLSENPFAVTTNEELYLTDPKKTLRGYFEREGHELQYHCEERGGQGQHVCKVELPIDEARGRPVVAEVMHTGKKKEAVVACALEACRILDRAGVLRQAKHESRGRKARDWSADDYYDSDDDNYLDRTGHVERKRSARMQRHSAGHAHAHALAHDGPLTYEHLLKQITELEGKITAEERALERLRTSHSRGAHVHGHGHGHGQADELDSYMATLSAPSMSVRAEISTCKMNIQKLKAELCKSHRLAELARPAHAPPLIKRHGANINKHNSVVYGKRIKLKTDSDKKPKPKQASKQEEGEFVEEVDSDEEETRNRQNDKEDKSSEKIESTETVLDSKRANDKEIDDTSNRTNEREIDDTAKSHGVVKMYGAMRPPENYVIPEDYFNQESDRDLPEIMEEGD